jgi:F-type H+-transporting ATPase subunit delta
MSMRASAARYAKALLDVALAESAPEQVERDLAGFISLGEQHPDLARVLANPVVPAVSKQGVVREVLSRAVVSSPVAKLLLLLAERDRLVLLPDLLDVYRERLREHQRVVNAEVTTATELSPEQAEHLRQRLMAATGRTVTMTTAVDPRIIGGVVTRIGSTVYDGSVARQLDAIRQRLDSR